MEKEVCFSYYTNDECLRYIKAKVSDSLDDERICDIVEEIGFCDSGCGIVEDEDFFYPIEGWEIDILYNGGDINLKIITEDEFNAAKLKAAAYQSKHASFIKEVYTPFIEKEYGKVLDALNINFESLSLKRFQEEKKLNQKFNRRRR